MSAPIPIDARTAGGFDWRINRACADDFAGFVDDPEGFIAAADATVIKRNSVRTVYRLRIGSRVYFVKRYARGDLGERLKARLVESKASREWRIMVRGREAGLRVPVPGAVAERWVGGWLRASWLATVEIPGVIDLVPLIERELLDDEPRRHAFLRTLGAEVRGLHEAGLFHRDLHSGNVLIRRDDAGEYEIHFIDLHRGSWRRTLDARARRWNLAFMLHSTSRVTTPADRAAVVEGYAAGDGSGALGDLAALGPWIEGRIESFERRRLRSRSKRCVVRSSGFAIESVDDGTLYYARGFGREPALAAIATHRARSDDGDLKRTRRTRVTAVTVDGEPLVVKEYFPRFGDRIDGGGRGLAAWRAGNALVVRTIPTATPLAYLRGRAGGGFLVMARAPGERLDHRVIALAERHGERTTAFREAIDPLIRKTAALFARMHDRGVFHGDLKACNVFVDGDGDDVTVTLVDVDRVSCPDRPLGVARRVRNLAQLAASITTHVGRGRRLAWFRAYADDATWRERRAFVDGVAAECASKTVVVREPIE